VFVLTPSVSVARESMYESVQLSSHRPEIIDDAYGLGGAVVFPTAQSSGIRDDPALIHYTGQMPKYGNRVMATISDSDDADAIRRGQSQALWALEASVVTVYRYDSLPAQPATPTPYKVPRSHYFNTQRSWGDDWTTPSPPPFHVQSAEGSISDLGSPTAEQGAKLPVTHNRPSLMSFDSVSSFSSKLTGDSPAEDTHNGNAVNQEWHKYLDQVPQYAPNSGLPLPEWKREHLARKLYAKSEQAAAI